jgi:NADPH-dependent 2,4-dienoyl-CoA reductase/sulfur reductase-like enzyme
MQYMVPPANVPQGFNLDAAQAVKQAVHIPVIAVGRIIDPVMAEDVIASGIADFVALGRACLADPEFPNKVQEGKTDEISPCVGCLTRCNGAPGIDPNDHGVSCMINPFTGHERFMQINKAEKTKNIVVVGGGMGGLEAAWISAARGHQVTLFEKNKKVGGQVIPGSVPPFKHELTRAIRFYATMCKKYGVDMRLGTEADTQAVLDLKPDEVILVTGATPAAPAIPNEGIPVVQAVDVLNGQVMVGKRVLIVGGGLVGLETAEYLLTQNRQVTVVEMLDQAGAGLHPSIQFFVFRALKEGGVDILTNTKVEKFLADGAICSTGSGELTLSGYDMVVLAVGSKAYNPLQAALEGKVPSLHVIGDAEKPRRIVDAIEEAARLAVKI